MGGAQLDAGHGQKPGELWIRWIMVNIMESKGLAQCLQLQVRKRLGVYRSEEINGICVKR